MCYLILGGSKPLPGWFTALMQWKLKLKWAFACVKEDVKACQDALCTYVPSKRWFGKFVQIGLKKVPQSPRLSGGGVQLLFGQCPNRGDKICKGASLSKWFILFQIFNLYSLNSLHSISLLYIIFSIFFSINCSASFWGWTQHLQGIWQIPSQIQFFTNSIILSKIKPSPPPGASCTRWTFGGG